MNHFASTAGTFQGKKDDGFKPATAASSDTPAWLSEAPAPSWKPSRAPVEGGTWQASATPAPATSAQARTAAASPRARPTPDKAAADWLSAATQASPAARAAPPARAAPAGSMSRHFANTAGLGHSPSMSE